MLSKTNSVLWVDPKNKTGNYGLLLVVFEVKGHNINLALIKRDTATSTRATPADGFITYALGEDYAFEKHLGIWSYRKSRKHYLLRLREEGKTVYYTMYWRIMEIEFMKIRFASLGLKVLYKDAPMCVLRLSITSVIRRV